MADAQTLFIHYRQVKNPNPVFTPPEGSITHPFCQKLMKRAHGYTESIDFDIRYLFSRLEGKRKRKPPVLRRRAIESLLQGLCFYYEPSTNRVRCTVAHLAIECGLVTKSSSGVLSKSKAIKALYSLEKDLGFIVYLRDKTDAEASIRLTSNFFKALGIFPLALSEAKLGSPYQGGAVL
ncbi:plasmid replication initiator RepA [Enterobacter ludwigii]|uniref:plasmid replication initiator RepA n=1 Tax=Enterobacter ludwigii TaxID=299767 RepID=UPI002FCF0C89